LSIFCIHITDIKENVTCQHRPTCLLSTDYTVFQLLFWWSVSTKSIFQRSVKDSWETYVGDTR